MIYVSKHDAIRDLVHFSQPIYRPTSHAKLIKSSSYKINSLTSHEGSLVKWVTVGVYFRFRTLA